MSAKRPLFTFASRMALLALPLLAAPAAVSPAAASPGAADMAALDQGWDQETRALFYFTPQGSRMMPYDWFVALERADGEGLISAPESMDRYGWPRALEASPELNPDNLPVGLVKDPYEDPRYGQAVGFTCAACHTGDITYEGESLRVDGAPSMADFNGFLQDLAQAVNAAVFDREVFGRFALRVLGAEAGEAEIGALRQDYLAFAASFAGEIEMRRPHLEAGPGRVDALTQIVNAIAARDLGQPENLRAPDAPVSYPHLWLSSDLDWVQWNGVASSPILRNVGELMGVFGRTRLTGAQEELFATSALLPELHAMETWVQDLEPPVWPEEMFGEIDAVLAEEGRELYARDCLSCHTMPPFEMTAPERNVAGKQFIKTTRVDFREVGTDAAYMLAMTNRLALTGDLGPVLYDGAEVIPAARLFTTTVGASLRREMARLEMSPQETMATHDCRCSPPEAAAEQPRLWLPPSLTDFKAGPLLGIWATAPYLHNGSVPNIYELLSPPEDRSTAFYVGGTEYDPERLGFLASAEDLGEEAEGLFRFDTTIPGNSNAGHRYPETPYSHQERMAVIEYLKSATLE